MKDSGRTWVIVLAAGDGTRLASITTDGTGVTTPKQYCSLRGGRTLLDEALDRSARIAPRRRTVTVVAAQHRRWWSRSLAAMPAENVVVQPRNQGTAPGVLLPLLTVLERDPKAKIVVLPSDHFVADEAELARSIRLALDCVTSRPHEIVLLGITPDAPEPDYGWILPRPAGGGQVAPVARFVEKPDTATADSLLKSGGAWNSFIFAAAGEALLRLYQRRLPFLLDAFRQAAPRLPVDMHSGASYGLPALYESIVPADFSRDLLQGSEDSLRLLNVPACGWTDLGTPARVAQVIRELHAANVVACNPTREDRRRMPGIVDLTAALLASPA